MKNYKFENYKFHGKIGQTYIFDYIPDDDYGILVEDWDEKSFDGKDKYLVRYFYKKKVHRMDGPAIIEYKGDEVIFEKWVINDIVYRPGDLPSEIHYEDGKVRMELWTVGNYTYRENGKPAHIEYDIYGEPIVMFPSDKKKEDIIYDLDEVKSFIRDYKLNQIINE